MIMMGHTTNAIKIVITNTTTIIPHKDPIGSAFMLPPLVTTPTPTAGPRPRTFS